MRGRRSSGPSAIFFASSRARCVVGQHRELQLQAFAERARADAGRIEALHLVQHGEDLVGLALISGRRLSAMASMVSRR